MKLLIITNIVLLCLTLFSFVSASKVNSEVKYLRSVVQRSEEKSEQNETGWDYGCGSDLGPHRWGDLSPDWSLCRNGRRQSPISLVKFEALKSENIEPLETLYNRAPASLLNDGNIIRLKWQGGFIRINEGLYGLYETQFHWPSEHTINGKSYPLEMQMMHLNRINNATSIVSVLFKLDEDCNEFLNQFLSYLPTLEINQEVELEQMINPELLKLHKKHFFSYEGSLTSPPCTEGVLWTILKKIYKISPIQLDILKASLKHENARPVQPAYGRTVYRNK